MDTFRSLAGCLIVDPLFHWMPMQKYWNWDWSDLQTTEVNLHVFQSEHEVNVKSLILSLLWKIYTHIGVGFVLKTNTNPTMKSKRYTSGLEFKGKYSWSWKECLTLTLLEIGITAFTHIVVFSILKLFCFFSFLLQDCCAAQFLLFPSSPSCKFLPSAAAK